MKKPVIIGLALGAIGAVLLSRKEESKVSIPPSSTPPRSTGTEAPGVARSMGLIGQLDERVQAMAIQLLRAAHEQGIDLFVANGYRSIEDQDKLYKQGRDPNYPGPIVTHAPGGWSWHEYRRAFDVAVIGNNQAERYPNNPALWHRIGQIGKSVGLEWGGDYTTVQPDLPHFEYHPGLTIQDARAGRIV